MPVKQKPTKVTKDDIELAEEISRVTTIKSLLDGFAETLNTDFDDLLYVAEQSNPVKTFLEIENKKDTLQTELQIVQAQLLQIIGQVGEEDAHQLADPEVEAEAAVFVEASDTDAEASVNVETAEIDEALVTYSEDKE